MIAEKVSLDEAKLDKAFYFVVNGVIYRRSDGRCLILKRDEREKVFPGKWASIGGKLEHGDLDLKNPDSVDGDVAGFEGAIPRLLAREAQEESGVKVKDELKFIGQRVFVRPDGIPVAMLTFAVEYDSGEVVPEEGGFTDFAWVNAEEVDKYDCIGSVPAEIKAAIAAFSKI